MSRRVLLMLPLAVAACDPHTADITVGDYTTWLAGTNSLTLFRDSVPLDAYGDDHSAIDCRDLDDDSLRVGGDARDKKLCTSNDWPPSHESWLVNDGFEIVRGEIDPWRGEAIVTNEGDLQLAFHHTLPGGADMRFEVVVDPNFRPQRCEEIDANDDGVAEGVELVDVDGSPWLDEWSRTANGLPNNGTLFYLNANAFQLDPRDRSVRWNLPREWRAGYATARFADDSFVARATRFGLPSTYIQVADAIVVVGELVPANSLFFCELQEGDDPESSPCLQDQIFGATGSNVKDRLDSIAGEVATELQRYGARASKDLPGGGNGIPSLRPQTHDNFWRQPDAEFEGLDGWQELHYSWIWFAPGSELEEGGRASGQFSILFDGQSTTSRMLVRGSFTVESWVRDFWTTAYLPIEKLEENGTEVCGQVVRDGEFVPAGG
ncbi:MAG: hypothetical protein H6732_17150 [Alphaproteobacteria bacterium]|nr:hypothetical protein [Alphaproteobacteria bacterium]